MQFVSTIMVHVVFWPHPALPGHAATRGAKPVSTACGYINPMGQTTATMYLPGWMTQSERDAQEDAAVWRLGGSGFLTDVVDWFWGEQQPIIRVLRRRVGPGSSLPKDWSWLVQGPTAGVDSAAVSSADMATCRLRGSSLRLNNRLAIFRMQVVAARGGHPGTGQLADTPIAINNVWVLACRPEETSCRSSGVIPHGRRPSQEDSRLFQQDGAGRRPGPLGMCAPDGLPSPG